MAGYYSGLMEGMKGMADIRHTQMLDLASQSRVERDKEESQRSQMRLKIQMQKQQQEMQSQQYEARLAQQAFGNNAPSRDAKANSEASTTIAQRTKQYALGLLKNPSTIKDGMLALKEASALERQAIQDKKDETKLNLEKINTSGQILSGARDQETYDRALQLRLDSGMPLPPKELRDWNNPKTKDWVQQQIKQSKVTGAQYENWLTDLDTNDALAQDKEEGLNKAEKQTSLTSKERTGQANQKAPGLPDHLTQRIAEAKAKKQKGMQEGSIPNTTIGSGDREKFVGSSGKEFVAETQEDIKMIADANAPRTAPKYNQQAINTQTAIIADESKGIAKALSDLVAEKGPTSLGLAADLKATGPLSAIVLSGMRSNTPDAKLMQEQLQKSLPRMIQIIQNSGKVGNQAQMDNISKAIQAPAGVSEIAQIQALADLGNLMKTSLKGTTVSSTLNAGQAESIVDGYFAWKKAVPFSPDDVVKFKNDIDRWNKKNPRTPTKANWEAFNLYLTESKKDGE